MTFRSRYINCPFMYVPFGAFRWEHFSIPIFVVLWSTPLYQLFSGVLRRYRPLLCFLPLRVTNNIFVEVNVLRDVFVVRRFLIGPSIFKFSVFFCGLNSNFYRDVICLYCRFLGFTVYFQNAQTSYARANRWVCRFCSFRREREFITFFCGCGSLGKVGVHFYFWVR